MSAVLQSATASSAIVGTEQVTDGSLTGPEAVTHAPGVVYSNGTAAGQAQHMVSAIINVGTGGTTLDLTNIAGADGGTRNFTSIEEFIIENIDTGNSVTLAPGAANGWTAINGAATGNPLTLEPAQASPAVAGGRRSASSPINGLAVSGTNKTILISAVANTANVRYTFLGRGT